MSDRMSCSACGKTEDPEVRLKRCAKCKFTVYCSRECQKVDWKRHKKICGQARRYQPPTSSSSSAGTDQGSTEIHIGLSPPQGLDRPISKPFHHLNAGTWLYERSEKDVYRLLIDAYRLRVDDNFEFDCEIDEDTIYSVYKANSFDSSRILRGFTRFLRLAASRQGLLPSWWDVGKKAECEALAMDSTQWHCLLFIIHKWNIMHHYGDRFFPMQLRVFAESVLLCGPGGMLGTAMMARMMSLEDEIHDNHLSFMDLRH